MHAPRTSLLILINLQLASFCNNVVFFKHQGHKTVIIMPEIQSIWLASYFRRLYKKKTVLFSSAARASHPTSQTTNSQRYTPTFHEKFLTD